MFKYPNLDNFKTLMIKRLIDTNLIVPVDFYKTFDRITKQEKVSRLDQSKFNKVFLTLIDIYLDSDISTDLFLNALNFINILPREIINYLDLDDIYETDEDNIAFDLIKNGDIFSIEIKYNNIGYLIEINNKDYKKIDDIDLYEVKDDLIKDIIEYLN